MHSASFLQIGLASGNGMQMVDDDDQDDKAAFAENYTLPHS